MLGKMLLISTNRNLENMCGNEFWGVNGQDTSDLRLGQMHRQGPAVQTLNSLRV